MRISTEQLEDCQVLLTIEVEPERMEKFMRRGARQLANRLPIPGFRKGKAPYEVVVAKIGKQAIYQEILEEMVKEAYQEALTQTQLQPVARAELEDVKFEPTIFRLRVPVSPQVKPGDYRSIRVEWEAFEVTDEDINKVLEELSQSRVRWTETECPSEYGDLLTLDIKSTVGDETVIDQRDWEFVPAQDARTALIPGLDAALIGMKPGETREFTLTYPADSNSRWAGKEAHFVVTLKQAQRRSSIKLDDEFAASVGDFQSLEELRQSIREGLKAERELKVRSEQLEQIMEALVNGAELVKYPPVLLEREIDELLDEQERTLRQRGISLDDYLKLSQTTREMYRKQIQPQAEQRLTRRLLLDAVAEREGISVTQAEIDAEIGRALQSTDNKRSRDELKKALETPAGYQLIAANLRAQKTLDRLLAIARGEVETAAAAEETGEPEPPDDFPVAEQAILDASAEVATGIETEQA